MKTDCLDNYRAGWAISVKLEKGNRTISHFSGEKTPKRKIVI